MKKFIKRILLTIVIVVILFLGINIKIGYDMFKNSIAEKSVQTMVAEIKAKEIIENSKPLLDESTATALKKHIDKYE